MADGVSVHVDGASELVVALTKAASKAPEAVRPVIQKAALNIKSEMIADARASTHFKGMAGSISYDTEITRNGIEAEIGPDKDRRGGALGNIAYFGTPRGGGTLDLDGPLDHETPGMIKALGDSLADLL